MNLVISICLIIFLFAFRSVLLLHARATRFKLNKNWIVNTSIIVLMFPWFIKWKLGYGSFFLLFFFCVPTFVLPIGFIFLCRRRIFKAFGIQHEIICNSFIWNRVWCLVFVFFSFLFHFKFLFSFRFVSISHSLTTIGTHLALDCSVRDILWISSFVSLRSVFPRTHHVTKVVDQLFK